MQVKIKKKDKKKDWKKMKTKEKEERKTKNVLKERAIVKVCITILLGLIITACYAKQIDAAAIGVPEIPFGFKEMRAEYTNNELRVNGQEVKHKMSATGPYSHYVDNSVECSDSNNSESTKIVNSFETEYRGTEQEPRCTIPAFLPEGSIVEIHGGPYTYTNDPGLGGGFFIHSNGTKEKPIFITGINNPRIVSAMHIKGAYIIVENVKIDAEYKQNSGIFLVEGNHLVVRNSEITRTRKGIIIARDAESSAVIGNKIHGNSESEEKSWDCCTNDNSYDPDIAGIFIAGPAENIWVAENEIFENAGNGISIGSQYGNANDLVKKIFIASNTIHDNRQDGIGTKRASDVIISENVIYSQRPKRPADPGSAVLFQYSPENVWVIFNHIFDSDYGVITQSSCGPTCSGGDGKNLFIVGNIIHDIHHSRSNYNPLDAWSNAAIRLVGGENRYIVSNTIRDVDAGINGAGITGKYVIENNIITNVENGESEASRKGNHIFLIARNQDNEDIKNNMFYDEKEVKINIESEITAIAIEEQEEQSDEEGGQETQNGNSTENDAFLKVCLNCLIGSPQFLNAQANEIEQFTPEEASLARKNGVESEVYNIFEQMYGRTIHLDILGNKRPFQGNDKWDIGAIQTEPRERENQEDKQENTNETENEKNESSGGENNNNNNNDNSNNNESNNSNNEGSDEENDSNNKESDENNDNENSDEGNNEISQERSNSGTIRRIRVTGEKNERTSSQGSHDEEYQTAVQVALESRLNEKSEETIRTIRTKELNTRVFAHSPNDTILESETENKKLAGIQKKNRATIIIALLGMLIACCYTAAVLLLVALIQKKI